MKGVMNLIAQAKAEQAANPMSAEDMVKESGRLARYGAAQAKKPGVRHQRTFRAAALIVDQGRTATGHQSAEDLRPVELPAGGLFR